jgi:chromosome partitioning protein
MSGQAWRVAVIAGKGGVGKTTTVINLGAGLAAAGRRCLLVDCDPQGNLTSGLGLDPYARRRTLSDVLVGRATASEAIIETEFPGLDLLPSHPDLSAVESELPARVNAELRLRNALRDGVDGNYDIVLFDTPPNFGFHTISALGAARSALVPLQMSAFALRGLKEVIRVIAAARRHLNPELELLGVVPTFVNNTRFSRDMLEALGDVSQVRVFHSEISVTVKLQESALQGVPVLVSAPSSTASRAYTALAAELIEVAGNRLSDHPWAPRNGTAGNGVHGPVAESPVEYEDEATMVPVAAEIPVDEAPAAMMNEPAMEEGDEGGDQMVAGIAADTGHDAASAEDAVHSLEGRHQGRRARMRVARGRAEADAEGESEPESGIAVALAMMPADEHVDDAPAAGEPADEEPVETMKGFRFRLFRRKAS